MDRPFKPKYGTVSQVLLQLVVAQVKKADSRMPALSSWQLMRSPKSDIYNIIYAVILWTKSHVHVVSARPYMYSTETSLLR